MVEGKDGIKTTGVRTGTVDHVETEDPDGTKDGKPTLNGDALLADVHTHPAAGHVISKPNGETGTATFEQGTDDQNRANSNGVTSYVVTKAGIYRYNPATDRDSGPVNVLNGQEFKAYMSGDQ